MRATLDPLVLTKPAASAAPRATGILPPLTAMTKALSASPEVSTSRDSARAFATAKASSSP